MEDSLIAALKSMLTLQRWNLHPKVETWVEAENAAMVTHLAYAIAKESDLREDCLIHLLFRTLLKCLNKHYMTDISLFVTRELKDNHASIWETVVNESAGKIVKLFPRSISPTLKEYLIYKGNYEKLPKINNCKFPEINPGEAEEIESIIRFCKIQVAIQECEINSAIYKDYYDDIINKSYLNLRKIKGFDKYNTITGIDKDNVKEENKIKNDEFKKYFQTIARLKYIRRWNTINRLIPSSVLAHTYIVTLLTLVFSLSEESQKDIDINFIRLALLRALFHDVPESLTGDIVTPVKKKFESKEKDLMSKIEGKLSEEFLGKAPRGIRKEIKYDPFLKGVNNDKVGSVSSLVKDCDRLASMVECLYEKKAQVKTSEMEESYHESYQELSNSEWPTVREFLGILANQWLNTNN